VGVSNTAGTLNFICNMKDACIGILMGLGVSVAIIAVIICLIVCSCFGSIKAITSSPVEEMYHRQLVNTIDSILDSRYPCGITEDDSAYPSIDSLSSIVVPNNR
jgi:hypothetical protein